MKKAIYYLIIGIGMLQIAGYVFRFSSVRGLGAATGSSPLPIVFTEVKGVETFASDFFIRYKNTDGNQHEVKITPELYSRISGPYNRRNVYGAAISYGPVLPKKMRDTVLYYALCKKTLVRELGFPATASDFSIYIKTKTRNRNSIWLLRPNCNP